MFDEINKDWRHSIFLTGRAARKEVHFASESPENQRLLLGSAREWKKWEVNCPCCGLDFQISTLLATREFDFSARENQFRINFAPHSTPQARQTPKRLPDTWKTRKSSPSAFKISCTPQASRPEQVTAGNAENVEKCLCENVQKLCRLTRARASTVEQERRMHQHFLEVISQ